MGGDACLPACLQPLRITPNTHWEQALPAVLLQAVRKRSRDCLREQGCPTFKDHRTTAYE